MAIDLVCNRHTKIQNMSLEEMAEYFANNLHACLIVKTGCPISKSCKQCWKEFLQRSDD